MEEVRHLLWSHAAACSRRSDSRNAGFRWWARVKGETGGGGGELVSHRFFPRQFFARALLENFILQNYLFVHMT